MPVSQAQVRMAFANKDKPGSKGDFAREVVAEVHERGPGSVKRLPARVKDGKPVGKKRKFGSLS